jgi:hypothetical protein
MSQPEMKVDSNGTKRWTLNNKYHREDGPAIEYSDGSKEWYLNDNLHRQDGPAVEYPNGTKYWYLNGELHREDGPAVEWSNGTKCWYLNGKEVSFEDYILELERRGLKNKIVDTLYNLA